MNWPAAAVYVSDFLEQKSERLCREGKSTRALRGLLFELAPVDNAAAGLMHLNREPAES